MSMVFGTGRDSNGNKVCSCTTGEGCFAIQTNGNLKRTDREGIGPCTYTEVREYVERCGTDYQRRQVRISMSDPEPTVDYPKFREACPFRVHSWGRVTFCRNDQLSPQKCPERASQNCPMWRHLRKLGILPRGEI